MSNLKEFLMIQRHNHMVAEICTKYEDEALKAIADGDMSKFDIAIKSLDEAQKNYRGYIRTNE